VAESAAKRYFFTTTRANRDRRALVFLRTILPVFVLLAPYGNPGSIPGRGTTPLSLRAIICDVTHIYAGRIGVSAKKAAIQP
jgi:hypothetical protein